jgi:hypothetical protein
MEISRRDLEPKRKDHKKMRTTSAGYGRHPRRTATLVAVLVVSLTATTTGTGIVLAGTASAQSLTTPAAHGLPNRTSLVEPSSADRYEVLSTLVRAVPLTAGLGSLRAVTRSAPSASSPGPGP